MQTSWQRYLSSSALVLIDPLGWVPHSQRRFSWLQWEWRLHISEVIVPKVPWAWVIRLHGRLIWQRNLVKAQ